MRFLFKSGDSGQSEWSSLKLGASPSRPKSDSNKKMGLPQARVASPADGLRAVRLPVLPSPQPAAPSDPPGSVSPEKPAERPCSLRTPAGMSMAQWCRLPGGSRMSSSCCSGNVMFKDHRGM